MASRALKRITRRTEDGREVMWIGERWIYTEASVPDRPTRPPPEQILAHPTERWPRYRLRVFDLCWPWRASHGEALRDASLSRNAQYDRADRELYLDAAAHIQRDPPARGIRVVGVLS